MRLMAFLSLLIAHWRATILHGQLVSAQLRRQRLKAAVGTRQLSEGLLTLLAPPASGLASARSLCWFAHFRPGNLLIGAPKIAYRRGLILAPVSA